MYINNNNNNINFRGFAEATRVVSQLGKTNSEINRLVSGTSYKRKNLLCTLANRYNYQNFYRKPDEKESPDLVIAIFKMLKNPNKKQVSLIAHVHGSLENVKNIFEQTGNSRKLLDFAGKLNTVIGTQGRPEMITEVLKSPYRTEYIKHFSKYLPYFNVKKLDKDAVKVLDSLVENGTYQKVNFEKEGRGLLIENSFPFQKTENLNTQAILNDYNPEGLDLIKEMALCFGKDVSAQKDSDKIILDIYRTTNKNNEQIRTRLLETFSTKFNRHRVKPASIFELKKLYDAVDDNKYARNFVTKFLNKHYYIASAEILNEVLYNIPNKKLAIFTKNAFNIINQTHGEGTINIMKRELDNPFFETEATRQNRRASRQYGYKNEPAVFYIIKTKITNYLRKLQDKMTAEVPLPKMSEIPQTKPAQQTAVPVQSVRKPEIILPKQEPAEQKPAAQTAVSGSILQILKIDLPKPDIAKPDIVKTPRETVIDNITSIIKRNLGIKTFERQNADYSKGATKMRLKLLPEIFASISDTRKADRAVGKKHINSSNKDALSLFLMINGSNRKFVNYLLKKRNTDGTRMFEVKDIINMLKQAEAKIKRNKLANPNYRARDTHRYYNHLYEAKVQQYGKVKYLRKNA